MAPSVAFSAVFTYIPILVSFDLSFREWDILLNEKPWVGLDNYQQLLAPHDVWSALRVTTLFVAPSRVPSPAIQIACEPPTRRGQKPGGGEAERKAAELVADA